MCMTSGSMMRKSSRLRGFKSQEKLKNHESMINVEKDYKIPAINKSRETIGNP